MGICSPKFSSTTGVALRASPRDHSSLFLILKIDVLVFRVLHQITYLILIT